MRPAAKDAIDALRIIDGALRVVRNALAYLGQEPSSSEPLKAKRNLTSKKMTVAETIEEFDALPDSANVRLPVVAVLFGVSTATIWRWCAAGDFPEPVRFSRGVTTWNVGALRLKKREAT